MPVNFCSKCGAPNTGANFCNKCGAPFKANMQPATNVEPLDCFVAGAPRNDDNGYNETSELYIQKVQSQQPSVHTPSKPQQPQQGVQPQAPYGQMPPQQPNVQSANTQQPYTQPQPNAHQQVYSSAPEYMHQQTQPGGSHYSPPAQYAHQQTQPFDNKYVSQSGYIQQTPPGHVHYSPAEKSKKKPLTAIAAVAAAVLVFLLFVVPAISGGKPASDVDPVTLNIFTEPPEGRDIPFELGDANFAANDPNIKMIEINQGMSYGFDTETGEFYLLDSFVAGKETAIFVDLAKPLDPKSQISLTIERNGEFVASMSAVGMVDESTLLFQPGDLSEVGFWEQGAYTFTFEMDDSIAVRATNFFQSMPLKVLAVPVLANYSGVVVGCDGAWQQGSKMITAAYPVAKMDVEYVLAPELDLSDPIYDLNTDEGCFYVWEALTRLQTADKDYTLIVGFTKYSSMDGMYLGFTFGAPANIVCESEPGMFATVIHEIAHCYMIGDEYEGGSLNDILNSPPYGMTGIDIITREPAVGTKAAVKGGVELGVNGTGSIVYPEQRAYWVEGRTLLGPVTSYMGAGNGEDAFTYWTTSDIWNHLFRVFTGQISGDEPGYTTPSETGPGPESNPGPDSVYWGQCFQCYGAVYDPYGFVECRNCGNMIMIDSQQLTCGECGTVYSFSDLNDNDLWIYHPDCGYLLYYPEFVNFNNGGNSDQIAGKTANRTRVIKITGYFDPAGAFNPSPLYAYEASPAAITANREGEYSVGVYDSQGKRLSVAYFDVKDTSQMTTAEGAFEIKSARIPLEVIIKYPENAAKILIQKGEQEIYTLLLSQNEPVVAFTGLAEGQTLSNNVTLSWEATDADGDELYSEIWYCRNDEEQYLIATDLTGTYYDVDLTDYPGSESGWFLIYTTDGANTGMDKSPLVSVPYKAPVILNDMPEITQVKITDVIELEANVWDAQDGWLWYQGLEWYVDGEFWIESFYVWQNPYMLKPGLHTFTLVATNSAGLSTGKDFVFEVTDDESDLPDDWSRNDIVVALELGFSSPLNRLEAPITRAEFAGLMFSLHGTMLTDDFKHLPDPVAIPEITDVSSNKDYMAAYFMVALGIMEAPGGKFEPQKPISEREAMQIIYKTIETAQSNSASAYEEIDDSVFVPGFEERGMFDEPGGPNAYQAEEKLSRKLALVRIGRLIIDEFDLE